jgi:hypothetical protein
MNGSFSVIKYSYKGIGTFYNTQALVKSIAVTRFVFLSLLDIKLSGLFGRFAKKHTLFYKKIVRFEL